MEVVVFGVNSLEKTSDNSKTRLKNISIQVKSPLKNILILHIL
jgi:hypothetical protein